MTMIDMPTLSFCEKPCLEKLLNPSHRRLFLVFKRPDKRPPILDEMMNDIDHVISSIAHKYTDTSCPHLHFDELMSQGYFKLAQLVDKGWVDRVPNRIEFFKVFKTSVNNHIKGLVHKYRFTMKRTGIRPPSRDGNLDSAAMESYKPIEISLDDPEANLQVGEETFDGGSIFNCEMYDDIVAVLTPLERMVLDQMIEPNVASLIIAELDAYRGKKPGSVKVTVRSSHQAEGLGMPVDLFMQLQKDIQAKVEKLQNAETEQEIKYNFALSSLERIFGVQIPRNCDRMIVKRLLTLAARNQHQKVTDDVAALLHLVGAKTPEFQGSTMSCFGVLYQRNHRICSACGLQGACRTEAMNVGLGDISIPPKLLGTKQTRIPALLPLRGNEALETVIEDNVTEQPEEIIANSERDEEILHYLNENFRKTRYDSEFYYKHKENLTTKKVRFIFWIGPRGDGGPLKLRFCTPGDAIKDSLTRIKNGVYLPDHLDAAESIKLIERHAHETYE